MSLLITALLALSYGPPSDRDALDAVSRRISEDAASRTLSISNLAISNLDGGETSRHPAFIRIARCERLSVLPGAERRERDGFVCILEVTPVLDQPFVTRGFFEHDGIAWRYHGPVTPVHIDRYDAFAPPQQGMQGKPGSTLYAADGELSELDFLRSPYADVLNQLGVPGF